MAGLANQNTAQTLAVISQMLGRRENEGIARGKLAREQASSSAMAEIFREAGLQVDPSMTGADLANTITGQIAMGNARRAQEEQQRKAREAMRERESLGAVANVRGAVGTELPDVLQSMLQTIPTTGSEQERLARGDTLTDIRDSAKRLEMARSVARPFQSTETITIGGPKPAPRPTFDNPLPDIPPSLGVDAPGFTTSLTTVPENVHALQRRIMTSGALPDASEAGTSFNVPPSQYPGGQKLLDEQRKARTEPSYTFGQTNDQGGFTPITMKSDPLTGERKAVRGETIPGVGKTKRVPTLAPPTESTTTRSTAPRPIRDAKELLALGSALDGVVKDVSGNNEAGEPIVPGFRDPKRSVVDIPDVGRVPKTKVLEDAFFRRHGTKVTIRWDGKKFVIVRAWEPGQTLETKTTRGPAPSQDERDRDAEED